MAKRLARLITIVLLRFILIRRGALSPQALFDSAWQVLHSSIMYRALVGMIRRRGTLPNFNEHLFIFLSQNIDGFYRSLELKVPECLATQMNQKAPFVILHFHDQSSFISKILIDQKRNFTRIVKNPEGYIRHLEKEFSDISPATAVPSDFRSLALLKKAIKNADALCCAIDYSDSTRVCVYVSPAAIEFANQNGLAVYFCKSNIRDSGKAELLCWGPFKDREPRKCANDFIALFNSHAVPKRQLTVKFPSESEDLKQSLVNRIFSKRSRKDLTA